MRLSAPNLAEPFEPTGKDNSTKLRAGGESDAGPLETSRWVRDETYRVAREFTFRDVPPGGIGCVWR
jgi:hypothetical protein